MSRAINPAALREIRGLVGLTQQELADRCGISRGTVANLELGRHAASPKLMRKFADALAVSIDAITGPAAQPAPEPTVAA